MYESPINKVIGDIVSKMVIDDEDKIMYQVKQAMGYEIDKNELAKALQYDRNQYEKGCRDALDTIADEIRHFMFEVNPSSSESDYACNYILDFINECKNDNQERLLNNAKGI